MPLSFSFATAGQIVFGAGAVRQVPSHAAALGRHVLLATGARMDRADRMAADLKAAGIAITRHAVNSEPDIDTIAAGADVARTAGCDVVVGFGGGSVMDAAKAIAALITNRRPIMDYLEVIGGAQPLLASPAPCIAVPTTAGTGSEVTRNAVIRSPSHGVKVSMRSPEMLPDVAVVDPELTLSMPPDITAASGCDALCQLLEAFVSARATPMTDALCREGLKRCANALIPAVQDGSDQDARSDMALASLLSGIALANGGLGAVHGIAAPLGGMHAAPHGAICARLLPEVTAATIAALEKSSDHARSHSRYTEAAAILTGKPHATAAMLVEWLASACAQFNIPDLSRWGLARDEIAPLANQALNASSMRGHPIHLSTTALEAIITAAWQGTP